MISVAAELAGVHPQTLRIYERKGLLDPARTVGGSRRYSDVDIAQLQRIQELTAAGLNLEGVKRVMELEAEVAALRAEIERLRAEAQRGRGQDAPPVPARPRPPAPAARRLQAPAGAVAIARASERVAAPRERASHRSDQRPPAPRMRQPRSGKPAATATLAERTLLSAWR